MQARITLDPQYYKHGEEWHCHPSIQLSVMDYGENEDFISKFNTILPSIIKQGKKIARKQGRKGESSIVWVSVEHNHFGTNLVEVFINT